jgi:hypothetical protein
MTKTNLFPHGKRATSRLGRGNSAAGNSTGGQQQDRDDATGGAAGMVGDRSSPKGGGQSIRDKVVSDRAAGTRPISDRKGATDGLGHGRGGLAVHPNAAQYCVDDYEEQHTPRVPGRTPIG